jgi:NTE family protein
MGEEIALVVGPSLGGLVPPLVAAARAASPRAVSFLDRSLSFAGALTAADDAATKHATVLIPSELDPATLGVLLEEVDRVVAVIGSGDEVQRLGALGDIAERHRLEVVLVGTEAQTASREWPADSGFAIVRTCDRHTDFPLASADVAWLARHLTRTKLGVALGAGGAKGYAHVGVLQVLEEAGYLIDYAGGSSIGGFVASHVALGHGAAAVEERFKAAFDEETVAGIFPGGPFGAGAAGLEALTRMLHEATEEKSFADTVIPLVIMAVDLTDRAAIPMRDGPLWQALVSALAVAGVFPTQERDGHRLVDAIALVPVPTASVVESGADIVVSCNLMGAETLDRWPEGPEIPPPPEKKRRGPLDTMLEVMDLSQLDTSTRLAALADVSVTPTFAPVDWRDFHLADLFIAAGRTAALEQLPALQHLSRPVDVEAARRESGYHSLV